VYELVPDTFRLLCCLCSQTQLERQIVATTNFFDECVPAQPGFSSSVAAVTIIPDAARVAKVWMKWYKIETKLRRLRYIKKIVRHKLDMAAEGRSDIYGDIASAVEKSKHGLHTATNSMSRQLSSVLSTTTLNLCGSADQSDDPQSPQRDDVGDPAAERIQCSNISNHEHEPLVVNQENTTIVCVPAECDLKSKKEEQTKGIMNESPINENDAAAPAEEKNVFLSLWSKWSGQVAQGDQTQRDIEMQPIQGSTHSEGIVHANHKDIVDSSSSSNRHEEKVPDIPQEEKEVTRDFSYQDFDVKAYARKLGFDEETELNGIVDGLGIEELSIFAREYAQSSANPCVYGTL
jgi:hypothetical protein